MPSRPPSGGESRADRDLCRQDPRGGRTESARRHSRQRIGRQHSHQQFDRERYQSQPAWQRRSYSCDSRSFSRSMRFGSGHTTATSRESLPTILAGRIEHGGGGPGPLHRSTYHARTKGHRVGDRCSRRRRSIYVAIPRHRLTSAINKSLTRVPSVSARRSSYGTRAQFCPAPAFNHDRLNAFALILPCARQVAVSEPAHYSGVPGCTGWG